MEIVCQVSVLLHPALCPCDTYSKLQFWKSLAKVFVTGICSWGPSLSLIIGLCMWGSFLNLLFYLGLTQAIPSWYWQLSHIWVHFQQRTILNHILNLKFWVEFGLETQMKVCFVVMNSLHWGLLLDSPAWAGPGLCLVSPYPMTLWKTKARVIKDQCISLEWKLTLVLSMPL